MILAGAILILIGVLLFVFGIRQQDLPEPEPVSPTLYLEQRKARIYEGLRDLQFEYRLGKLSDEDYQHTKLELQRELAGVMAEVDGLLPKEKAVEPRTPVPDPSNQCPHCGAHFEQAMKFCGECGKQMTEAAS
ncbi:MAG: hypothetical protein JJE04_21030 [Acidobacteriia bacterium]|nr:hypothetical protein [Terriglobia bacterium]